MVSSFEGILFLFFFLFLFQLEALRKENAELKSRLFALLNNGQQPMEDVQVDLKRPRSQEGDERD